jgi:hypothetical protein
MDWIHLAEGRNKWQAVFNTAMKIQTPQNIKKFFRC